LKDARDKKIYKRIVLMKWKFRKFYNKFRIAILFPKYFSDHVKELVLKKKKNWLLNYQKIDLLYELL